MKVIITGGRNYNNPELVQRALRVIGATHVVHGGCSGADSIADDWARRNNVKISLYPADWDKNGRAAGPIRNHQMLKDNTDAACLLAFAGGNGTKHCVETAKSLRILVMECK